MKRTGKVISLITTLGLILASAFLTNTIILASSGTVNIPNYMQPNTTIIYNDDLSYEIKAGGEPTGPAPTPYVAPSPKPAPSDWSQEEKDKYNYENKLIEAARQTIKNGSASVVHGLSPVARPGLKVTYGNDGIIMNIYYPNSNGGYTLSDPNLTSNASSLSSVDNSYIIATWGSSYPSILTYDDIDDSVVGTGRFTCYSGQPGDHDNTLVVGDCATKQAYDNITDGISVTARNLDTQQVYTYTKNDCGGMPEAVLDMWETGINLIGGDYYSLANVDNGRMYHPSRTY